MRKSSDLRKKLRTLKQFNGTQLLSTISFLQQKAVLFKDTIQETAKNMCLKFKPMKKRAPMPPSVLTFLICWQQAQQMNSLSYGIFQVRSLNSLVTERWEWESFTPSHSIKIFRGSWLQGVQRERLRSGTLKRMRKSRRISLRSWTKQEFLNQPKRIKKWTSGMKKSLIPKRKRRVLQRVRRKRRKVRKTRNDFSLN